MENNHLELLMKLNNYLDSKSDNLIESFNSINQNENIDCFILHFTYNILELLQKNNQNIENYDEFNVGIETDEINEIIDFDYDSNNKFEEYNYWKFKELSWTLLENWIVKCFINSNYKKQRKSKFYLKHNHDSLEIFDLLDIEKLYERNEFNLFYKNNIQNTLELFNE